MVGGELFENYEENDQEFCLAGFLMRVN